MHNLRHDGSNFFHNEAIDVKREELQVFILTPKENCYYLYPSMSLQSTPKGYITSKT